MTSITTFAFAPMFAASIEGLAVLFVIYVISAIANWIKRKQEEKVARESLPTIRQTPQTTPAPSPAPAAPQAKSWEEELKRLLEGEVPVFQPPPPQPPPIIVNVPAPAPPPVLKPATRRAEPEPMSEESEAPTRPLATFKESGRAYREGLTIEERTGDRMRTVESLSTAEAAYIGASQLSDRVAERMRQVVETTRNATPDEVRRRRLAANSGVAHSLLNSPATARQAVIASLLLGPPKAMEN